LIPEVYRRLRSGAAWTRENPREAGFRVGILGLIVTLIIAGGAAPAAAASASDCYSETVEAGLSSITGSPAVAGQMLDATVACTPYGTSQDAIDGLSETQGYQQSLGIKDTVSHYETTMNNRLQGSRALAAMTAKTKAVNELNNGTSKSVVKDRVNETIDDYYTQIQMNTVEHANTQLLQLEYLDKNTSTTIHQGKGSSITDWQRVNVTLANGTQVETFKIAYDGGYTARIVASDPSGKNPIHITSLDPDTSDRSYILTDYSDSGVEAPGDYSQHLYDLSQQAEQVKTNAGQIVENIYAEYASGQINASDVLDPITLANRAGTQWNTTGGQQWAAIELATLGYSGNISTTATVTTNKSGATYEGTLFYTAEDLPNGTIVAGETYDTTNLNGSFVMAVQGDGNNTWVEDFGSDGDAKVTVEELRDSETGDTVNSTQVLTYSTEDTDVSALENEIARLANLTEFYRNQGMSGGGGDDDGLGISTGGAIAGGVLLLILGAMVVRNGGQNGGDRGRY